MAVSESKKRFSISLDKELYELLKAVSEKNRRTMSAELEIMIEEKYKNNKK